MSRTGILFAACAMAIGLPSAAAGPPSIEAGGFGRYVDTFNSADMSFVDYYTPDVVFDKGDDGKLVGRDAIASWYANFWQDFDETLTPLAVAIDRGGEVMMVELRTELVAKRDGFRWRGRTYAKGDRLIVDGTIVYGLRNGLISSIRGGAEGRQIIAATQVQ